MSSKFKIIYVLAVFMLFLGSIAPAGALEENFNAYSKNEVISVCSCALSEDIITIDNIGDVKSSMFITRDGEASKWASLSEDSFYLNLGERKSVHSFLAVPCDTEGEYGLETRIQTSFGFEKVMQQTVKVNNCVNVNVVAKTTPTEVCPCTPLEYKFEVQNTGTFVETYRIDVAPYSEYVRVSENVLILEPGETGEVHVFVALPCEIYEDVELIFTALAEGSNMKAELPFAAKIKPCYDYTFTVEDVYHICQDTINIIPIELKNNADISNLYSIDVSGLRWAETENSSVFMWGKEQNIINLILKPESRNIGEYSFTLTTNTQRGDEERTKDVALILENCYDLSIDALAEAQVVNCESIQHKVDVANLGTKEIDVNLQLDAPTWVTLKDSTLKLKQNETKSTNLLLNVPCNQTEDFEVGVIGKVSARDDVYDESQVDFELVPMEKAYKLTIGSEQETIRVTYNRTAIPLTLENVGIREATYDISLEAENWIKLDQNRVTLDVGAIQPLNIITSPVFNVTEEGYYPVTINARLKDTNLVHIREIEVYLKEKTFFEKVIDNILIIILGILLLALLVGMIFFARWYRNKHPRVPRPKALKPIKPRDYSKLKKILLIVLLALIAVSLIGGAIYLTQFLFVDNMNETNATDIDVAPPPVFKPTIMVNRTNLEGHDNVIVVRNADLIIPLIIQNNDPSALYHIDINENVSWIESDKTSVNLRPGQRSLVNLMVYPNEQIEEGSYKVMIDINIVGRDEPLSEEIILEVVRDKSFMEKYGLYVLAGLIILMAIIIVHLFKERKPGRKVKVKATGLSKYTKDDAKMRKILLIILLVLIATLLLFGGIYLAKFVVTSLVNETNATASGEGMEPSDESSFELEGIEDMGTMKIVEVKRGETLVVPLKITNENEEVSYQISINEDVYWINATQASIEVPPGKTRVVEFVVSPDKEVETGSYKVIVDVKLGGTGKSFQKEVIIKVINPFWKRALSYLPYFLLGIGILGGILIIMARRDEPNRPKKMNKYVPSSKATKTNIKLGA